MTGTIAASSGEVEPYGVGEARGVRLAVGARGSMACGSAVLRVQEALSTFQDLPQEGRHEGQHGRPLDEAPSPCCKQPCLSMQGSALQRTSA